MKRIRKYSFCIIIVAILVNATCLFSKSILNIIPIKYSKDSLSFFQKEYQECYNSLVTVYELDESKIEDLINRTQNNFLYSSTADFCELVALNRFFQEIPGAEFYLEKAKNYKIMFGDTSKAQALFLNCADLYDLKGDKKNAERSYQQLKKLFLSNGSINAKIESIILLGNYYYRNNKYIQSLKEYQQALDFAIILNDKAKIADCFVNLSIIHGEILNTDKAIELLNNALTYNLMLKDNSRVAVNYSNIGSVYLNEKDYPKALYYAQKSLNILKKNMKKGINKLIFVQLLHNMGQVYKSMDSIDIAEKYYKMSIDSSVNINNNEFEIVSYISLINMYLDKNIKIEQVPKYIEKVLSSDTNLIKENFKKVFYYSISKYKSRIGDFQLAYEYFSKGKEIDDRILNFDERRVVANLEYKREVEQKQTEIDLAELKIHNEQMQKYFYIVIVVISLIFLIVLMFFIKNKIKINKMLSEKNIQIQNANTKLSELNSELEDKNKIIEEERAKSETLLLNILPVNIAERLKAGEENIADLHKNVSVIFIDIVDFTELSAKVNPDIAVSLLNRIFRKFDEISEKYSLEKIKTIGDSYMAVSGINFDEHNHAAQALNFAKEALEFIRKSQLLFANRVVQCRCGIDCGEVIAGVIGTKKFIYDIWGDTVNTAARMEQYGLPGRINITDKFKNALDENSYVFEEREDINVKGKGFMKTWLIIN